MKDTTQTGLPAQGWPGSIYHSWSRKDKKVMGEYKTCYVKIPNCRPSGKLWTFLAACFYGKGDMQKELVTWARYVAIFHPSDIIRITSFFLRWTQHHFKGCCSYRILGTLRFSRYPDSFLQPGCHSQEELNATRSSRTGTGRSSNELSGNNHFTITGTPYPSLWGTARDGFGYLNRNIAWSMIRATDCMDHIWLYNCRWLGR